MLKFWFGRITFYLGLIALVITVYILRTNYENGLLLHYGDHTTGVVLEKETKLNCSPRGSCHKEYYIKFRFSAPVTTYFDRHETSRLVYDSLVEGGEVPVLYYSHNPKLNTFGYGNGRILDARWLLVMYILIALLAWRFDWKASRTYAFLLKQGKQAPARITSVERGPKWLKKQVRAVKYEYTAHGARYTAREEIDTYLGIFVEDYIAGAQFEILYDPKDPKRSMIVR